MSLEYSETVYLDDLDGFEFEMLCQRMLERAGMGSVERIGGVADGGRDLIVHRPHGGSIIVECKHQPSSSVGRPIIQKLHSVVISSGAAGGMVITTGRYTAEAVEHAELLSHDIPIELYDMHQLADLAEKAGIRLVVGDRDTQILCFPASDMTGMKAMFSGMLGMMQSHPGTASELARLVPHSLLLRACYVISAEIDQDFRTSVGLVHRIRERDIYRICDAQHGGGLNPDMAEFLRGSSLVLARKIPAIACPTQRTDFVLDAATLKDRITEQLIREHTKNVTYVGRNNRTYQKRCEPGPRSVHIKSIRQVLLPQYSLALKFLENERRCTIIQNNNNIMFLDSTIHDCRICGRSMKKILLCNSCGITCHPPKFFRSESHTCKSCKKTLCRNCTFWFRRLFFFKGMLCKQCADLRPGSKRKLVK